MKKRKNLTTEEKEMLKEIFERKGFLMNFPPGRVVMVSKKTGKVRTDEPEEKYVNLFLEE